MNKLSLLAGLACAAAATPFAFADSLYVADSSNFSIVSSDLDGQNETTVTSGITTSGNDLFGLTASGSTLYWTLSISGLVQSYDLLTGTKSTLANTTQPTGIAATSSFLYWLDATDDALYRSDLDGQNRTTLVSGSAGSFADPTGLTVTDSAIYWTDVGTGQIMRSDLNGGSVTTLAAGISRPTAIAVNGSFVYWALEGVGTGNTGKVQRANLGDGSNVTDLVTNIYRPEGLLITGSTLYWSETAQGVGEANLDGSNPNYVISDVFGATGLVTAVPEPPVVALLAGALLFGFGRWRRRMRATLG
jgi:hypothetical protein